jgi:tetratricopeptide (TPR) repeat protein
MSLLMDALRKAEAEKKLAAGEPLSPEVRRQLDDTREIAMPPPVPAAGTPLEDSREQLSLEPMQPSAEISETTATTTAVQLDELPKLEDYFDDPEPADFLRTRPPFASSTRDNLAQALRQTVVNAQTVFDAGGRATTNWILGATIVVTVVLAIGLAAAGFFYLQKTPVVKPVPSPLVANAVEKPRPVSPRPAPAPAPTPTAALPTPPPVAAPVEATAKPVTEDVSAATVAAAPALEERPKVMPATPKPAAPAKVPALDPDAEIAGGEVHIARTKPRAAELDATLRRAYAAYAAGRDAEAERLYREVLAKRADQTDALLGLGAIHLRAGKPELAHAEYARVRKLDPDNAAAAAALFMIEGGAGTQVTEAQLKLLLDHGTDNPPVHFALGNYYAREGRWADAQQSYFEAYSRNHGNADYAYNLGVSLDRLGQRAAALDYYRKALELIDAGGHGAFARAQLAARVEALGRAE